MATSDHAVKLTQMKEQIQKLGSSAEKYEDPTLERFLVNKSMDPNKAAKMFVAWQKWRASFVPQGFIPDSEVVEDLKAKKLFIQGLSKGGIPVAILLAGKHYPSKDQDQFKKFVVHMLDKAIASGIRGKEIGNEKVVVIMDFQHLGYKNVDTQGFIAAFQILQAYYPERLAKLYMLNMPWFFASVWKIISVVLEKSTSEKHRTVNHDHVVALIAERQGVHGPIGLCPDWCYVPYVQGLMQNYYRAEGLTGSSLSIPTGVEIVMVTNEKGKKQMIEEVGKEALPEELGGNAKLVLAQDVQVPQLKC